MPGDGPSDGRALIFGSINYRQWNGTVYYEIVPVELQSFNVE